MLFLWVTGCIDGFMGMAYNSTWEFGGPLFVNTYQEDMAHKQAMQNITGVANLGQV